MRYVRRVLQPGETIVYATTLHWIVYLRTILLLIICIILAGAAVSTSNNQNLSLALGIAAVIFLLLGLSAGLSAFIRRAATELAVTNHRVIYKSGLLSRHTIEERMADIFIASASAFETARVALRGPQGKRD